MAAKATLKRTERQLSTATDEERTEMEPSPAPKRQRVSRACDQCRAAREKCDGIQPLCFPCASQNRQCSWEEPKKKRGVQTGYIRTLELSLGWIFDKIPGSEDALHGLLTHEGGQGRALLVGKDLSAGNRLHRRWRKSIVHQEIDRVLSGGGDATAAAAPGRSGKAPANNESSDSDGEPTKAEVKEVATEQIPAAAAEATAPHGRGGSSSNAPRGVSYEESRPYDAPLHPGVGDHTTGPPRSSSRLVRLPPNCWRLLDIYFAYTHCWFPVLEKARIHKACWSYPADGLDPASGGHSSAFAELWAALALAAYQEKASQRDGGSAPEGEADGHPDNVYQAARSLIPPETAHHDVSHVNAVLLLTMIKIGRGELSAAWILAGLATRMALGLGLHLPQGGQRQQHSYMACFILDTLLATRLGRPPHLRADDTEPVIPADSQDDWEIWAPCLGFGVLRPPGASSRSPAHSTSSFASFYGIHRVHSDIMLGGAARPHHDEPYLTRVRKAISKTQGQQPFVSYITNGGICPIQVPSIHLLRLAFLCYGSQTQVAAESLPATILQCVDEYLVHFGHAVPPLFPAYMDLVAQQYGHGLLKGEIRERWKKVDAMIRSVWTPHEESTSLAMVHKPAAFSYPPSNSNNNQNNNTALFRSTPHPHTIIQQLPTPASLYADTPADQTSTVVGGDMYHDPTSSGMLHFSGASRPRQPTHVMDQIGLSASSTTGFDLPDAPPPHYTSHTRPSFSNAPFDYDSILDDIASLGRADRMGSDSQFMTNLGFAPGSDLTELLAQEYTGIP